MARLHARSTGDRGSRPLSALDRAARTGAAVPRWAAILGLAVLLVGTWAVVYVSGGSQRALPHLFYIPIILSVLPFGWQGAMATALTASVLCGPLMPLSTATGEAQQVGSWLFRSAMFLVVGSLAYLAITVRGRTSEQQLSTEIRNVIARSPVPGDVVDESLIPLVESVLKGRRFHPVFQPVYSLDDGRLLFVEALTRFDVEPYRSPDRWFAAAIQAGHGTDLDIAAIEEVIAAAADLPPEIQLSVNVSPTTLADPRLHELIRGTARQLVVEITEHAVVEDYHLLRGAVCDLRALGVRIAVDDAGAGIASLRHIVQLAPEIIKLDISLTQGVGSSPLRRALAGALIDFAQSTGAELVVEGIEEISDLTTWTLLGADAAQGFLVGWPSALPVAMSSSLITSLRGTRV